MYQLPGRSNWPDGVDLAAFVAFVGLFVLVPALGYFFMVADYRAYLRSLRTQLVRVFSWHPDWPAWAATNTPRCLAVFDLKLPCTQEDLLRSYRAKILKLHPDHGGDKRRFMLLQKHFEEAQQVLRQIEEEARAANRA